jgi:hypothetical protein
MTKALSKTKKTKGSGKEQTPGRREPRDHTVSLEDFAQRKGQIRALEEFHKRKDHKRLETAKALRKYRKAMKQEGFEAGHGASRKRSNSKVAVKEDSDTEERIGGASDITDTENNSSSSKKIRPTKRQKTNPFQKSLEKAKQNKIKAEQHKSDREEGEKERQKKILERKRQSKLMAKRTKKGQPIMKHVVDNLLAKLEKQES